MNRAEKSREAAIAISPARKPGVWVSAARVSRAGAAQALRAKGQLAEPADHIVSPLWGSTSFPLLANPGLTAGATHCRPSGPEAGGSR
jgi:hypothetical protein